MLLAFLVLISLLSSVSPTKPPRKLSRAITSVGSSPGTPMFECWAHSDGDLHVTSQGDCAKALKRIMSADKANAPMVFSRNPNGGYHVPAQIDAGTCIIYFDVASTSESAGMDAQLPMRSLVATALHIVENCLKNPPASTGLGGRAVALSWDGSKGFLDVLVWGQPPPAVESPPLPNWRTWDPLFDLGQ
jgi:hypothetical protein